MATIDVFGSVPHSAVGRFAAPANPFQMVRRWTESLKERHALARLARFEPHLLVDMGLDPEVIYEAAGDRDANGIDFNRFVQRR